PGTQDPEALSRVAPVVLYFFAHATEAVEHSAEAARTTCQVPAVLAACRSLAAALHAALSGASRTAVITAAATAPGGAAPPTDMAAPRTDTAPAALAAALDVFARTQNFRDAVLAAANLGGNSDVVASVCGALAGAHYAASAIPPSWRTGLARRDLIESCADRLLAHALLALAE
ncbi:MAG: ADP-ribosylglycohydrolase family protein, partial [Gammaproteobacteria bacterium]|nr:ADP-ribosylglycohydrolase family protein [Gammaproteobacteria bacterium]